MLRAQLIHKHRNY